MPDNIEVEEITSTILDEEVSRLSQAIDIAILLGAQMGSPVGSFVYIVKIQRGFFNSYTNDFEYAKRGYILGAFQDLDNALLSLRNYCLDSWQTYSSFCPWQASLEGSPDTYKVNEDIFVSTHTTLDIIDSFFEGAGQNDMYEISRLRVSL